VLRIVGEAGHLYRPIGNSDWGIDGEIEFKDDDGHASGLRLYLQLKAGNSHLRRRKSDGAEIFRIKKPRHAGYWQVHEYPVFLVIRTLDGRIRWMEISSYLKTEVKAGRVPVRKIIFQGESLTTTSVREWREKVVAWLQAKRESAFGTDNADRS
jgi:hypothetical protein